MHFFHVQLGKWCTLQDGRVVQKLGGNIGESEDGTIHSIPGATKVEKVGGPPTPKKKGKKKVSKVPPPDIFIMPDDDEVEEILNESDDLNDDLSEIM